MTTGTSPRRFVLLGGPGGWMTVLPAGSPMRADRYAGWTELARANLPRRRSLRPNGPIEARTAAAMKRWALDVYGTNA